MKTKKIALSIITGSILVASQMASAHTRLQSPSIDENAASHGSNYNNQVIGHGCRNPDTGTADIDTLATVLVFPDGVNSTITVDGVASDKKLIDFVSNWGSPVQKIQNKDVFTVEEEIKDPLGNVVGFWAGGGGLKGGLTGVIPFRTSGVIFEPASCAKTVKFIVSIADICKLTTVSGFNDADVMLWTPAVGSMFDGTEDLNGYNSPATLMVNRTSELPEACGGVGSDIVVTPSAAQLNRDMSVEFEGVPLWPLSE